jgi:hypothetical protein
MRAEIFVIIMRSVRNVRDYSQSNSGGMQEQWHSCPEDKQ